MDALTITDVSPRDGLQSQPTMVATADKLRLVHALSAAGLLNIEVTSFVSPGAVPQMADADVLLPQVVRRNQDNISVLVPNLRGLDRAVAAGATSIAVVLSASETMNRKNIGMDLEMATTTCVTTLRRAADLGLATRAYVAVAFECPFEGIIPPSRVRDLAMRIADAGVRETVIADTIGAAAPVQIQEVLQLLLVHFSPMQLGLHLHDTRGMALANAWAAIQLGIRRFDASVGGLGGCPFAPGAAGNLATEDLVLMASQCGLHTGVDLAALLSAVALVQDLVGYPVGGRSARWLRTIVAKESYKEGEKWPS